MMKKTISFQTAGGKGPSSCHPMVAEGLKAKIFRSAFQQGILQFCSLPASSPQGGPSHCMTRKEVKETGLYPGNDIDLAVLLRNSRG